METSGQSLPSGAMKARKQTGSFQVNPSSNFPDTVWNGIVSPGVMKGEIEKVGKGS